MRSQQIQFRDLQPSDYNALAKLISDTWDFEKFCSIKVANYMSKLYLASSLANQTYICIAENNDEVVGIITGRNEEKHRTPFKYILSEFKYLLPIMLSKEGRSVLKFFSEFDKIDKALLEKSDRFFEGELSFFAVRSDQRGLGIGKRLYTKFLTYMESQDIDNFFLFTDSSCNYGFYDYQGLNKLEETEFSLRPLVDEDMLFFLYAKLS